MDLFRIAIEEVRKARGLTRYGMARAASIDPGQFHRFLNGQQNLGPVTLGRLIRRFPELSPHVLLFLQSDVAHSDTPFSQKRTPRRGGRHGRATITSIASSPSLDRDPVLR